MKAIFYRAVLVFLLLGFATPSQADTDQHCLSLCISGGASGPACLAQCTYNKPRLAPAQNSQTTGQNSLSSSLPASTTTDINGMPLPLPPNRAGMTHNVLTAPQPLAGDVIISAPSAAKAAPDKDYTCVMQCLKNGEQYQQCNQRCTKVSCPTGSSQCKDLLGLAPTSTPPLAATVTR
jgi:hypothetical protein